MGAVPASGADFLLTLKMMRSIMTFVMKTPKSKARVKNAYTPTEVGTLIDGFKGEFKIFGEKLDSMSGKLDATYEQTSINTEKISLLEIAVQSIAADLKALTNKVGALTADLKALTDKVGALTADLKALVDKVSKNTDAIAALTASIDKLANTKLDREEFHILETRVSALETKLAAIPR